jgi:hypothetical protein
MARMTDRFHRELGREIGTDANPRFWARNFGMDAKGAASIIEQLKRERRCIERDGKLYAI